MASPGIVTAMVRRWSLLLLVVSMACGRDTLDALPSANPLLRIVPRDGLLFVGQTLRFEVDVLDEDGVTSVTDDRDLSLSAAPTSRAQLSGRRSWRRPPER
ncbi:MAG: hypothetical protein HC923_01575 [Myxococcales bacterium]|nr:hypothetical protein [Myxococcales bacterium]